ncbi:DUF2332 domain-containing protein [Chachezhania sediminis]|uniref:DUF2332 domain-containing protein n=1 Tax=Chachezhania sediminis TaxID=2599291 RepID=UPI00131AA6FC|nr:DUF2332 family protein [Chachezhania sediminis]
MSLLDDFRGQARACTGLGSPFMGILLEGLADNWPEGSHIDRICRGFDGDTGPNGHSLPLRVAGGLHALVLTGQDDALAAQYPPNEVVAATLIPQAIAAMDRHRDFFTEWMKSPPQTNEVRRSAALIAGAHWVAARHPLPFVTSELGASGGLNTNWDRYALQAGDTRLGPANPVLTLTPDWDGPVPTARDIRVDRKAAVDLRPVDLTDPAQALRMKAYLWADQPHRVELTTAAMAAIDTKVEAGDAADWLETQLASTFPGHVHLIYHTIAWQYFPADVSARATALIEAAGARATDDAPLAWLSMEADATKGSARLGLRLWPGDTDTELARVDFHGHWIKWLARPEGE